MTNSEVLLSKIAFRLAILVAFCLLGHLPDWRFKPAMDQVGATESDAGGDLQAMTF